MSAAVFVVVLHALGDSDRFHVLRLVSEPSLIWGDIGRDASRTKVASHMLSAYFGWTDTASRVNSMQHAADSSTLD